MKCIICKEREATELDTWCKPCLEKAKFASFETPDKKARKIDSTETFEVWWDHLLN